MLLLLFKCGNERYGIDVRQVIEVAPLVRFKKIPKTPEYIACLFNYRGSVIPVVDLTALLTGTPSRQMRSTRIILILYLDSKGAVRILGLVAEKVTDTVKYCESDFQSSGITSEEGAYLDTVAVDRNEMIQLVEPQKILPESLQQLLFAE
ncbi:MAG: purine-binding chemotaxis protein CheW [Candidatus Latescibacteria bacterium]|nr:purine-binding chemotaxis protein CheW [Candidatus Latescibacterota bacterium]